MYLRKYPLRFALIIVFILLGFLYSVGFLCYIQIFRAQFLANLAQKQHEQSIVLEAKRGSILDRNGHILAGNVPVYSLYANPRAMKHRKDLNKITDQLAMLLNKPREQVAKQLARDKYFVWLARKLPQEKYQEIKALKIPGIGFKKESRRSYPNKFMAAHVIGFSGIDNVGLEGLERQLDKYLKGTDGRAIILRDAKQKELLIERQYIAPIDGFDVTLTIDETIQFLAERSLEKMYRKYNAKGATIIVMDVRTGEILAFANRPTYDLNEPGKYPVGARTNHAVVSTFEPGSVFKIVAAAAGFQEGVVHEDDKIFCENGAYRVGNHILHDHDPLGLITFREVIEKSSNIGTVKIVQKLGAMKFYEYARHFRFGMKIEIDLKGEVNGWLKHPRQWSKTSIGAIPIGQEVTVTPLQLVAATAALANDGIYMRPHVVKQVVDHQGQIIYENKPTAIDKIMTVDMAKRLRPLLQGVVDRGTAKKAQIPGVTVGGKTGTAQKVVNGRYSHSHFYATFIGFAPVDKPRLAAVVVFDEPRPVYYGGLVAAPVFAEVIGDALQYLDAQDAGIPEDKLNYL